MVAWCGRLVTTGSRLLLGQVPSHPTHTVRKLVLFKLVSALILLTIGGVALVVLAWLTLRIGRRQADRLELGTRRAAGPPIDDWACAPRAARQEKPAHEPDE